MKTCGDFSGDSAAGIKYKQGFEYVLQARNIYNRDQSVV